MSEIIVVQGYAGAGKSTISKRISRLAHNGIRIGHVSAGMRLRAIRTGAEPSRYASLINSPDAPSPLPDEVVNGAIFEQVNPADHALTLIDGYPRHESGVDVFTKALRAGGHRLLGCLCLEVTQQTSVDRILSRGQREGELLKGASLAEFAVRRYVNDATQVQAAVSLLGGIAPVEHIDANGSIDELFQRSLETLERLGVVPVDLAGN
jgi:adenylate kinase family enzyme